MQNIASVAIAQSIDPKSITLTDDGMISIPQPTPATPAPIIQSLDKMIEEYNSYSISLGISQKEADGWQAKMAALLPFIQQAQSLGALSTVTLTQNN